MLRISLIGLALLVLGGTAMAQAPQPDMNRCRQLMAYYDRFARAGEGTVSGGQIDRSVGGDRCRQGKYAEGVKDLEAAIRALGLEPPPRR